MRFTWYTYAKAQRLAEVEFNTAFVRDFRVDKFWQVLDERTPLNVAYNKMKRLRARWNRENVARPPRIIREIYQLALETRYPSP